MQLNTPVLSESQVSLPGDMKSGPPPNSAGTSSGNASCSLSELSSSPPFKDHFRLKSEEQLKAAEALAMEGVEVLAVLAAEVRTT